MSTAIPFQPVSIPDYLEGELRSERKHEYLAGEVYAMTGGTAAHSQISANAIGMLYAQLRGKRCRVFTSDMKIRVRRQSGTYFYYPDASVVCQSSSGSELFQDSPVVIIEVISESTRRVDEHEKRDAYLSIASLSVYILVEQEAATALVYRRKDNGFEREVYAGLDTMIPLPEIECELALGELYENVAFSSGSPDTEC